MKKLIKQVSPDGKMVQITIADERWYIETLDDDTFQEYASTTWIADYYPKGIAFYKWLANKGWDEAESIKTTRGTHGSKVHEGIELLSLGNTINMDDKLVNPDTGEKEEITLEEYEALMSFTDWHKQYNPKMLKNEFVVFNKEHKYAGTVDYLCEIEGKIWLIDFKTSAYIWPSHEIQLSAYKHALPKELQPDKMAILQVGYPRNKNKWKLTEIEDQFDLFLAAKAIWAKECGNIELPKKDYPTSLSL